MMISSSSVIIEARMSRSIRKDIIFSQSLNLCQAFVILYEEVNGIIGTQVENFESTLGELRQLSSEVSRFNNQEK